MSKGPRRRSASSPKRRKFVVTFNVSVEVEIDDDVVVDALSADFKESHYDFSDASDVAAHLGYNFARGARLPLLDGFAHWSDGKARLVDDDWDRDDVTEINP